MLKEQRDQIAAVLSVLEDIDLHDAALKVHGAKFDFNQKMYQSYSLKDLIIELNFIVQDLKTLLQSERWKWASHEYVSPTLGHNNPYNHVAHIKEKLETGKPFSEFGQSILWLHEFLVATGNYGIGRSEINQVISQEELNRRAIDLQFYEQQLQLQIQDNQIINKSLVDLKEELQKFYQLKLEELKSISDALVSVSGQKAEVDNIYKSVLNADNDIRTKFKNQEDLLALLNSQKEAQEKEFKAILQTIEEQKGKLDATLSESDGRLKFFEGLETFVKDKQKEIIELGALAAGAALGGTFGLRKTTLETETNSWKKWIPIATAGALVWIIVVFTCLGSVTSNIWIDTILKLAKTIPAFVLMGFVFKQYTKERNLQEEYAFKASVANTIKAYADLLKGEDSEANKSKQAMLIEAIKRVQSPPKLGNESNGRIFSFSTRNLAKSIEQLNESIKNIKP